MVAAGTSPAGAELDERSVRGGGAYVGGELVLGKDLDRALSGSSVDRDPLFSACFDVVGCFVDNGREAIDKSLCVLV